MKSLILGIVGLCLSLAALAQTSNGQPIDGTDCSNLFFKALLEEDAAALGNLISNDFSAAGLQGQPIQGHQLLQMISQGHIVVDSGMLSGARSRSYGDVAIVNGLWHISARIDNNSFQGELSYMSVCVKSGGRWKVVGIQFTPVL